MITETKEIYKCEHCRKVYQVKRFAEGHELMCKKNPENKRACFGCNFLAKKDVTLHEDHPMGGSYTFQINILFCAKKSIHVYPPKVEIKGNHIDLGDEFNEPMPKDCEFYKPIEY